MIKTSLQSKFLKYEYHSMAAITQFEDMYKKQWALVRCCNPSRTCLQLNSIHFQFDCFLKWNNQTCFNRNPDVMQSDGIQSNQ